MKYGIFALRDGLTDEFLTPTIDRDETTAIRAISNVIESQPNSLLCTHAGDFGLYKLGTFDSENGCIILNPTNGPEMILVSLAGIKE